MKTEIVYRTVVEAVLAHAAERPESLAVAFKKDQVTYRELCTWVRGTAYVLHEKYGIGKGDFVILSAVSKPEYVIGYLAVQYLGVVSIPLDKANNGGVASLSYMEPKLMLLNGKIEEETENCLLLKDVCEEGMRAAKMAENFLYQLPADEELAEILLSTGTTGKPKGGMLSIGNVYASSRNTYLGVGMKQDDIVLIPLPLHHSFGMRVLRTSLFIGATVILQNGFTFAKEIERNMEIYHCTGFVSAPASLEMIYRQMQEKFPEVLGKLRYMEVGSGSLSDDMKRKLLKILPDTLVVNSWGSTETGGAIFLNLSEHTDKITSIGKPIDGVDFRVVDTEGQVIHAMDADTAGRMALRGPMQMMGYYQMPEVTKETLVDGWLYTNDIVYQDEDGFVYMLGRADDIINVGGEKVSPIEVENVAQEFEKVRECACIGVDDPDGLLGRVPVLYVVPENGQFDEDELVRYLSSRLEKYKLPHRYMVASALPRNRMEKLDRRALAQMWQESADKELMNDVVCNILSRRSVRDFTEEDIPKACLDVILQCGYYAPSGHNMQTWRFTVIQDQVKISLFKEVAARVAKEEKAYFYGFQNPNVLILVSNDRRNSDGVQDSSCAAENMMLAANSYGIGSVWINVLHTICDVPEIRALLDEYGVPKRHIVWATIAMGYPQKPGKLLAKKTDVVKWVTD